MNLTTPREPFLQHLQFATTVCPARSVSQLHTDVFIKVDAGSFEMTSTDGMVSVRRRFRHEGISGDGSAALPAAVLLQAIRSIDDAEITLTQAGQFHEVKAERAYFKLNSDDPDQYPVVPSVDGDGYAEVPMGAFVDLCSRTMFAVAKDLGRYAFHGLLLELDPDQVSMVATDGRRLALASLAAQTGVTERRTAVLPLKGFTQLMRLASEGPAETLRIFARQSLVAFRTGDSEVIVQVLEGEFPDFRAVLPSEKDLPGRVAMPRNELSVAIHRAMITAGDEGPIVRLVFTDGQLAVMSRQEGVGESRSELPVDYGGAEVEVRFNPVFLAEYLKTTPEESVTFHFRDRTSAGLFSAHERAKYVVMPITS